MNRKKKKRKKLIKNFKITAYKIILLESVLFLYSGSRQLEKEISKCYLQQHKKQNVQNKFNKKVQDIENYKHQ